MAYWNLHERTLVEEGAAYSVLSPVSGNTPLRFFHFSGLALDDPASLSRNTDRFTLAERRDLQRIFAAYAQAVLANRKPGVDGLPYGFDSFSEGTSITRLARRLYAAHASHFAGADPFASTGPFGTFARQQKLVAGKIAPGKGSWREFNPHDRRVETVHKLLRLTLRVLGPHRYDLLMRYLSFITILRHQAVFLRDPGWPTESPASTNKSEGE